MLGSLLPLNILMSGIRCGRSERAVRAYVTNMMVDGGDFRKLAQLYETGREGMISFDHNFDGLLISVLQNLLECSCLQLNVTVTDSCQCCKRDCVCKFGHHFCCLTLMVGRGRQTASSRGRQTASS